MYAESSTRSRVPPPPGLVPAAEGLSAAAQLRERLRLALNGFMAPGMYIYIYIYVCKYVYKHTYIHIFRYLDVYTHTYVV